MGFQTFSCVICGESVTRRTSFQYGNGRACRKHQEVLDEQKKKLDDRLDREFITILKEYKKSGMKTPTKDYMRIWLVKWIDGLRQVVDTVASANKGLSLYKETGLITLQYSVSDQFVSRMLDLIKTHANDDDWEENESAKSYNKEVKLLINSITKEYTALYLATVGASHLEKDQFKQWVQSVIDAACATMYEVRSRILLKRLQVAEFVSPNGNATEQFVDRLYSAINKAINTNSDSDHHQPKERRGAKVAPRRKPATVRVS